MACTLGRIRPETWPIGMSTVGPRGLIGAAASIISCPDAQLDASAEIPNHCVGTDREVRRTKPVRSGDGISQKYYDGGAYVGGLYGWQR